MQINSDAREFEPLQLHKTLLFRNTRIIHIGVDFYVSYTKLWWHEMDKYFSSWKKFAGSSHVTKILEYIYFLPVFFLILSSSYFVFLHFLHLLQIGFSVVQHDFRTIFRQI